MKKRMLALAMVLILALSLLPAAAFAAEVDEPQTGAVAALSVEANKGKTAYFGGMDHVRFKKKVVPGDTLRLECRIIKQKGPVGIGSAVATVDGKVAVSAELTFMIG